MAEGQEVDARMWFGYALFGSFDYAQPEVDGAFISVIYPETAGNERTGYYIRSFCDYKVFKSLTVTAFLASVAVQRANRREVSRMM